MTRKEAAEIVEKYIESFEGGASIYEALKMAADALKDEDAVIDNVLEIIDKDKEEHAKYDRLLKPMWLRGCFDTLDYLRDAVLALKGGEQE